MIHRHDRPALLSDDLNRYRPRSGADFAHKTRRHKPTISTRHPILSNHSRPPKTLKPQVTALRNNPKQGSDQTQEPGCALRPAVSRIGAASLGDSAQSTV